MRFLRETLGERVLIKPYVEKVSKGGILISRDTRSQAINTDRGEVFMVGPSAWYDLPEKPPIKVGDKVFYSHYGCKSIKVGEDFLIVANDKDILIGYVEDEGTTSEVEHE